jgi:hypothetical protein
MNPPRDHDGWCRTKSHTTGKCDCHLLEIEVLEVERNVLLDVLRRIASGRKRRGANVSYGGGREGTMSRAEMMAEARKVTGGGK